MQARRDVFHAISDPTRREIIGLIVKKPMNLNAIAGNFDVSRPAISQHVKILEECGLLIIRKEGRERYCEAKISRLDEVSDWVERQRRFWTSKLDDLGRFLEQEEKSKQAGKRKISKSKTINDDKQKRKTHQQSRRVRGKVRKNASPQRRNRLGRNHKS